MLTAATSSTDSLNYHAREYTLVAVEDLDIKGARTRWAAPTDAHLWRGNGPPDARKPFKQGFW